MAQSRWMHAVAVGGLALTCLGVGCKGPAPAAQGPAMLIDGEPVPRAEFVAALIADQGEAFARRFATERVIEAQAKAAGVNVADDVVDKRLQQEERRLIAQRFGADESKFLAHIAEYGVSRETWRATRRRRLRTELQAAALMQATIPPERLKALFEQRYGVGGVSRDVHHLLISTSVAASTLYTRAMYGAEKAQLIDDTRARAETLRRELLAGADFGELARAHSDDFTAERGGDLGGEWQGRYGGAFDAAVAKLRVGELSAVVEGKRGFHLIQATGKRRGARYSGRVIVVKVHPKADDAAWAEAQQKAEAIHRRLTEGREAFDLVARQTSEDPRGRAAGGATGAFGPGQFGDAVDPVLERLALNEISPPLRTEDGYLLITLDERTFLPTQDRPTVRHILLGTAFDLVKQRKLGADLATRARARAEALLAQLQAPDADFEAIAREASEDPLSRQKGGALAPFVAGALGPEVDAALAAMKPGELRLVESKRGFHILRLDTARKADFAAVEAELAQELRQRAPKDDEVKAWIKAQSEKLKLELKL